MKNRRSTMKLATLAAASAVAAGMLMAPAASAAESYGYSAGAASKARCDAIQTNGLAQKRSAGYTITHLTKCRHTGNGYWNGYFRYSKGLPAFY